MAIHIHKEQIFNFVPIDFEEPIGYTFSDDCKSILNKIPTEISKPSKDKIINDKLSKPTD